MEQDHNQFTLKIDLANLVLPCEENQKVVFSDEWLAIHEAGHAVVAETLGLKVKTISTDRKDPGVILEDMTPSSVQGPTHFGGYLATERAQGVSLEPPYMCEEKPLGCDRDRDNASFCAGNHWKHLPNESELSGEEISQIREEYLIACQTKGWEIIKAEWPKVLGLAEQLLREPKMDGDRCRNVLSEF